LLIYRRLQIDIAFIVLAFVVCLIYLFSFAADNGAEIDPNPIYLIMSWILLIALTYVCLQSVPYGIVLTSVIAILLLIGIISWISYGAPSNCGLITLGVAIVLVVAVITAYSYYGWYECLVLAVMLIIVVALSVNNYIKESLLVIVIAGIILGFGPSHSLDCS
jgi:hypothetical protein